MSITTTAVSSIALTYTTGTDWAVFTASNLATAGNLQQNWNDMLSGISAQYKILLNSARDEVNILEGASGAQYVGISGFTATGVCTGTTLYSAVYSMASTVSAINTSAAYAGSAAYAASAGTAAAAATALAAASATYAASAGTLSGLSMSVTSINNLMSTATITYYVDKDSGSDSNGGLAWASALQSIQTAINKIPQILNHAATINLATGNYGEIVSIGGYMGSGSVTVSSEGALTDNYTINAIQTYHSVCPITIIGLKATSISGDTLEVSACNSVVINYFRSVATALSEDAVEINYSNVQIANSELSNKNFGINAQRACVVYSNTNSGSGNNYGLGAQAGSTIGKNSTQPAGTVTSEYAVGGGAIR